MDILPKVRGLYYLILFLIRYANGIDTTAELSCDIRELVTCGNNMGYYSWEFCRARTRNIKRILSVHLDLRYPNRYCRNYGTPQNFGLTEPGDSMWVIKNCFGTFLLCLEVESPSISTTIEVPSSASLSLKHLDKDDVLEPGTTEAWGMEDKVTGNSIAAVKDEAELKQEKINNGSGQATINDFEIILNENEKLDFTTKVLIIAAITTAGLCLVCLVATIGCMTMMRKERSEWTPRARNDIDPEETTVTSLPVYDFRSDEEGIYNVIPFDEDEPVSDNNKIYEQAKGKTCVSSVSEVHVNESLQDDLHIYATVRGTPCDTGNTSPLPEIAENEYDRLRNNPKICLPDSSTYNRLSDVLKDEGKITTNSSNVQPSP